ncbi:hypothetical protein QR77_23540 [Streptomyces sp. 150FB]|uniref:DUF4232 domain-containing protein n=1 Tax=Streptomyces sp. 150FB TaxID=1576605 RepID=UPI0005893BAF|nr:DUF4232 domain-containing protein [Streptomyces sp. 150FB]KIF76059.1 hypothetical protein QR77_23540 [Streptomyces sp. 150FB]
MRSIRNRAAALTATALLSTLALTACGNGEGVQDAGGAGAAKISTTGTPATTTAADTKKTDTAPDAAGTQAPQKNGSGNSGTQQAGGSGSKVSTGSKSSGGSKTGKGSGNGSSSATSSCGAGSVKLAVVKVERPINHMLLTATNTGSKTCDAYNAPFLRFDQDQAATQVIRESVPQAVVSLSPGQTAYASILMSSGDGSGTHGRTAKQLGVFFAARDGEGSVGDGTTLSLPAGSHIDDSAAVSYWQSTMDLALTW